MADNVNFRFQAGQSCYTCRHRQYQHDGLGYTCKRGDGDKLLRLTFGNQMGWAMHVVVCDNWEEALREHVTWRRKYIEDRIGTEDGDE